MANAIPRVSIGLPVYNGERVLEATLDSLLAQTFTDFELLISDNASTDRTEEICRAYAAKDARIRYDRHQENLGAARNYNHVFELSRGEYFKWAADDDTYAPRFLEVCVAELDKDPSVVLAFTNARFIDEHDAYLFDYVYDRRVDSNKPHVRFFDLVGASHIIIEVFGVIRSSALRKTQLIGNYVGSDRVLLGKLALCGRFARLSEPLFFHREHPRRSMYKCATGADQAEWFDPANKGRIVLPRWKHMWENLLSIIQSTMNPRSKLFLLFLHLRLVVASGQKLVKELQGAAVQALRCNTNARWLVATVDGAFNILLVFVSLIFRILQFSKRAIRRAGYLVRGLSPSS